MLLFSFCALGCVHQTDEISREPSSQDKIFIARTVYEKCDENKLYLENQFRFMPAEYFRLHTDEYSNSVPLRCIQVAQQTYIGHYAVCKGDESQPLISEVRPCLTQNYVTLAYNAFHDVMDCFNLDPHDYFLQIMIESGFHVNAINKSGMDSGISQFTANGIKKVTANNLVEKTRRLLLESSRSSCQRISNTVGSFNIDAFSVQKRCAMISLPKNPYRAMVFNYLHMMIDQILIDEMLSDLPEIQNALTDKIKKQFIYLSYNRGLAGLKKLLRGYIESRNYFSYQITEADLDLNKNLSQVKNILALEPEKRMALKKSKVRNLSFAEYAIINGATYVSDMAAAYDYVQRNLGNSCGEL